MLQTTSVTVMVTSTVMLTTKPFQFTLRKLAAEIRIMIYPLNNALALPHDDNLPALLVALIADRELFAEALKIYRQINIRLMAKNEGKIKTRQ
jgi:hypothetical protein